MVTICSAHISLGRMGRDDIVTSPATSLPPPVDDAVTKATVLSSAAAAAGGMSTKTCKTLALNKLWATRLAETEFTTYPSDVRSSLHTSAVGFTPSSSQHQPLLQRQQSQLSSAQLPDGNDEERV